MKKIKPPKPPKPPLNRLIREPRCFFTICPKCGSSMKRTKLFFFGKKKCIHPECGYEI